jgi:cystine transport system substrate-binding protein
VILGAASFDDALSELDDLERTARHDRAWIERSRSLRASLLVLSGSLAERTREVQRLRRSAEAAASALTALRRSELERAAQATRTARRARTLAAAAARTPAPDAGPVSHAAAPSPPPLPSPGSRTLTVEATAYALPGFTATGSPVGPGTVAVDPAVVPLGSQLEIPGYGRGVAADTGPSVKGARIDVWFETIEQARAWGTQTVTITITGG